MKTVIIISKVIVLLSLLGILYAIFQITNLK
jgi:hypothetical protein